MTITKFIIDKYIHTYIHATWFLKPFVLNLHLCGDSYCTWCFWIIGINWSSYLELHFDSINVQDFILETKARNDVSKQSCKWQYLNLGMFLKQQQLFPTYGRSTLKCVFVSDNQLNNLLRSSSSLSLPHSPPHSINIACRHLTLAPFWRSLAFCLQRINPLCSPCLPLFLYLRETFLWSDSIGSNTQHSEAQSNGHARFEAESVLTAGCT